MNSSFNQIPQVTIVIVPRERFSLTQASLESLYQNTQYPFKLVYIDGNSPPKVRSYLEKESKERDFEIIRKDYYLSPNHARNIGLKNVDTKYILFCDNDVILELGWLKALVTCAEETGASVVGPLMCEQKSAYTCVHFAGGESHVVVDIHGKRHLREKMYKQGKQAAEIRPALKRMQTELTEFHCMLIKREIFNFIGGQFDEAMLNTKEHLDFCMSVTQAGGTIYFEPAALATYVSGPPLERSDIHYYMLRWSIAWGRASLEHLKEKWNLTENSYFKAKYQRLSRRRNVAITQPFSRRLTFGVYLNPVTNILKYWEHKLNRLLTDDYAKKQMKRKKLSKLANSISDLEKHKNGSLFKVRKEEESL